MSYSRRSLSRTPTIALLAASVFLGGVAVSDAQRHPESVGPLSHYRDEPGTLQEPEWKHRPAFVRGPRDRHQRGRTHLFLNDSDNIPYLNYADEDYILYQRELIPWTRPPGRATFTRRGRWDRMGSYMGSNFLRIFNWEEARTGNNQITASATSNGFFGGTPASRRGLETASGLGGGFSYIDHRQSNYGFDVAGGLTGFLLIGHYTYKNLHWTTTTGIDVRTLFTPLTLDLNNQSTARVDLDWRGVDQATLLFSRGGSRKRGLFSGWSSTAGDTFENSPVLMYGGHWKRNIGDYAHFGTTLVNQFMAFPSSSRSSAWRGDLPYSMVQPRIVRIFVADDSPGETRHNARVYDMDVIIEGIRDEERVRLTSIEGDVDYDAMLEPGLPVGGALLAGGGREAQGRDAVIYTFNLPQDMTVTSTRFQADVADDYRIGVRQTYDFPGTDNNGNAKLTEAEWPVSFVASEGQTRRPFKWNVGQEEEPYYTVVRSSGQLGSGANRRIVSFDYGMPTGQSMASVDWHANLIGLTLSGEVSHNLQNYMFPVGNNEGRRSTQRAWAYWFQGFKDLSFGAELGGEVYRMEPDYAGGYDSQRGGMAFHADRQDRPGARVVSKTQEFALMTDNDDDDQHPDALSEENFAAGEAFPGWPNAGVYPGFDSDFDNIADPDRNENFIVDWEEPFLMFDADPPEFVYGIDFNNNTIPDFRENDDLPDYPYRRDQTGRHLFLRFAQLGGFGDAITLGTYDSEELVGGGASKSIYMRYEYNDSRSLFGDLQVNVDLKRVEDDISDHTYLFLIPPDDDNIIPWLNTPDGSPEIASVERFRPATPDPLQMRDSFVSTIYLDSKCEGWRNITIENAFLWLRNSQAEIELDDGSGLLQEEDIRSRFIVINKLGHSWSRGAFTLTSKFKHRSIYENPKSFERSIEDQFRTTFEGLDITRENRISRTEFIPIVSGEYALTPKTRFMLGAQGVPLFNYKRWDRKDKAGTFNQTDYLGMLKIQSEYFGFDSSFFIGYQRTRREFSRFKSRDYKRGTLFAELIAPF
ncbi:MAG: hypothetical protein VX733_15265 [Candidatus Latescibacterota bacterium]|nr:hypothetical protein [Candidatus Latescibacterota bacterium]